MVGILSNINLWTLLLALWPRAHVLTKISCTTLGIFILTNISYPRVTKKKIKNQTAHGQKCILGLKIKFLEANNNQPNTRINLTFILTFSLWLLGHGNDPSPFSGYEHIIWCAPSSCLHKHETYIIHSYSGYVGSITNHRRWFRCQWFITMTTNWLL